MKKRLLPFRRVEGLPEEMSDVALLKACAASESVALAALFDRYHLGLRRFLGRLSGVDDAALDDLVQTTFIEIFRSAGSFKGRSQVRTWLFGIAANVARHHVRSEARRAKLSLAYSQCALPDGATPDAAYERRQILARLEQALASLPHRLKVVFSMCDLEGISGVEAARVLGLRKGTLYRRLHEARLKLRAAIEGGEP